MINKILIANRGEIAVRIIRACKEMGIATVAIVSEADRDALHAFIADEVVCVGGPQSKDSYLNIQNICSAAVLKNVSAVHPGFGFLSENAEFAEILGRLGIKFIGPDAESIRLLGDKATAKETMMKSGVPTIPGSDGEVKSAAEAASIAAEIGYPVLIKASAGGGGRGIRPVMSPEELESAFAAASDEALKYFGNGGVYIEKLLINPRHVEFQILADELGNIVHLGERDCSMQRRKQKVIEETPCSVMTPELREKMGQSAVMAAKAAGYKNTGTVEFLLDSSGNYYFMEMNTRIQVEHTITEMVTGIDLIKAQIRIADGQPLGFTQEDVQIKGHAIECRICAEIPEKNFMPSSGTVGQLYVPGGFGVRFDTALYQGYTLPMYYDSMIGKLIAHDETREGAIAKMKCALVELIIDGVETNEVYQHELLSTPEFTSGNYNTGTLDGLKEKTHA